MYQAILNQILFVDIFDDPFWDFFDRQMFPCTVGDDEISWWKGEIHHKLHFHMFSCYSCLALAWGVWIAQIRLFWQYLITLAPLLDCYYTNTYFIFCWRKELDGGLGNTYTISKSIVKVIKRILDSLLMLCCFCICNSFWYLLPILLSKINVSIFIM